MAEQTTALARNGSAKPELPTLAELRSPEWQEQWQKNNSLNVLLNQNPPNEWCQQHPYAKRKVVQPNGQTKEEKALYLPISRQEMLMTQIFVHWYTEILSVQLIANSICATVRVHYQNPVDGKMQWMDGVGAVPLQTDKGAGAVDFNALKASAVQMGAPAAKSYAFKDAVENIGNIFGKDLNRTDLMDYTTFLGQFSGERPIADEQLAYVEKLITDTKTDRARFLTHAKVEQLGQLTQAKYEECIPLLLQKLAANKPN